MNTTNKNTLLITGGSAGIGFEIAKLFSQRGDHVIITGRDKQRLKSAEEKLTNITAIACDVSKEEDIKILVEKLKKDFPSLNIVINNAGRAALQDLSKENPDAFNTASEEMLTNYLSVIRLNEALLPLLKKQKEAAIVNVSSIVVFAPTISLPTYSASKAALHSYTLSLRLALEDSTVKVFELMPPLVDTELSKEIGGENGIKPSVVAHELLKAFETDTYEIHVGNTAHMYKAFLASPQEALMMMNGKVEQ